MPDIDKPTEKPARAKSAEDLLGPVQFLRGVGPQRAELLAKLGLQTVVDILFFFPRSYQDFSELTEIRDLQEGQAAAVTGTVIDTQEWATRNGTHVFAALIERNQEFIRGIWFNQRYMKNKFADGQTVMLQGTPKFDEGRWEMVHARVTWFANQETPKRGTINPIYSLTNGLNQRKIREIVAQTVTEYAPLVAEVLPTAFRDEHQLCDIQFAIQNIHRPQSPEHLEKARNRFVYQELFVLQAALAMRRERMRLERNAPALPLDPKIRSRILRRFPFELSESQMTATAEIARDMSSDIPMNRLLHGEVGSGKTVVAAFAMLLAVANGKQAILMAPTELLARQHVRSLEQWLKNGRVKIGLWTGSQNASERKTMAIGMEDGSIQIVIGTHALLASAPKMKDLGLVVIDEQHKFGVRQRSQLRAAGNNPHYLVMTATPIPRTLAMAIHGDMDVSVLDEKPGGRQPVKTSALPDSRIEEVISAIGRATERGEQAFWVCPKVDIDDDGTSAVSRYAALRAALNVPVGLVHGRLKPADKDAALEDFRAGRTKVLVATTVIEVGVDVPNATIMVIERAEGFGLAQLHQLRGRVGRGDKESF